MNQLLVSEYSLEGTLDYPGRRYDGNFIVDGEKITPIPKDATEAVEAIDTYLLENDLPLLAERIPIIAYGGNVNPSYMTSKFAKYSCEGTNMSAEAMKTIPGIYGTIQGSDVVWHGRPGQTGGFFAELYKGDETKDTSVQVAVEFLTPEQLAVLHTTEGLTYGVSIQKVSLEEGFEIDAVLYAARDASVLLDEKGAPISVAGIKREATTREVMTARDALEYTLSSKSVIEALGYKSPEDYIAEGKELMLAAKKARQLIVQEALEGDSKTRAYRHETFETQDFGRANFVNLPRGIEGQMQHSGRVELMEQSIAGIRPDKEEYDRRFDASRSARPHLTEKTHRMAADPAESLRKQATAELENPERARLLSKVATRQHSNKMIQ